MGEFFGSVLFSRLIPVFALVLGVCIVAGIVMSVSSAKKNKKASKALSNTKSEKEVITEKETETEVENETETEVENEAETGVKEFEYKGQKLVKYAYGASEWICKPENSAKWITMAQNSQNTGRLENSKEDASSKLIINDKEDNFECLITGDETELNGIAEKLDGYKTYVIENEIQTQNNITDEIVKENEA